MEKFPGPISTLVAASCKSFCNVESLGIFDEDICIRLSLQCCCKHFCLGAGMIFHLSEILSLDLGKDHISLGEITQVYDLMYIIE